MGWPAHSAGTRRAQVDQDVARNRVADGSRQLVSVSGGKLTGFAGLAASAVELVGRQAGRDLPPGPGAMPLPGAASEPVVSDERLHQLYGADASHVVRLGAARLVEGAAVLAGEVDWAVKVEAATTVEDVIYRRTLAAWFLPQHRSELAESVAQRMVVLLGWSPQERQAQVLAVQQRFAAEVEFA